MIFSNLWSSSMRPIVSRVMKFYNSVVQVQLKFIIKMNFIEWHFYFIFWFVIVPCTFWVRNSKTHLTLWGHGYYICMILFWVSHLAWLVCTCTGNMIFKHLFTYMKDWVVFNDTIIILVRVCQIDVQGVGNCVLLASIWRVNCDRNRLPI